MLLLSGARVGVRVPTPRAVCMAFEALAVLGCALHTTDLVAACCCEGLAGELSLERSQRACRRDGGYHSYTAPCPGSHEVDRRSLTSNAVRSGFERSIPRPIKATKALRRCARCDAGVCGLNASPMFLLGGSCF